jgi:LysM repeat protein
MKKPSKLKMARLYRGRKTPFWDRITGRRHHRLSASVTGEGDWEVEVPQIRMSRAFAVMLVLHIIAVGGLFAYRIWGRDEEPKAGADNAVAAVAVTESAAPAVPELIPPPAAPATPATTPEVKTYTWRAGDSIQLIAARFGVSTSALREANPDKTFVPGSEIALPRAGRIFGGAEVAEPAAQPSAIFDPQADLAANAGPPEPPAPRAVEVPETPEETSAAESIPPRSADPAVVAQPVTSRPALKVPPVKAPAVKVAEAKKGQDKKTAATAPPASAAPAAGPPKQPARTAGQRVHVVAKGDTVYNLARKYGFSADEIAKTNGLGGDYRITLGQQLKIPVKR